MTDTQTIKDWNRRSLKYKDSLEGVLPKSFPRDVNLYIDDWMYARVSSQIKKDRNLKILDVGSGYGRLAKKIIDKFPRASVYGIDVAQEYVSIFNETMGKKGEALLGDATELPFPDKYFDYVYVVTTYMYLTTKEEQEKAFSELFRVLKPGGKFVIIERNPVGYGLVTLGGLIGFLRGRKSREIKAVSYSPRQIKRLVGISGGRIIKAEGMPVFTLSLPFMLVWSKLSLPIPRWAFKFLAKADAKLEAVLPPSLYISYACSGIM